MQSAETPRPMLFLANAIAGGILVIAAIISSIHLPLASFAYTRNQPRLCGSCTRTTHRPPTRSCPPSSPDPSSCGLSSSQARPPSSSTLPAALAAQPKHVHPATGSRTAPAPHPHASHPRRPLPWLPARAHLPASDRPSPDCSLPSSRPAAGCSAVSAVATPTPTP